MKALSVMIGIVIGEHRVFKLYQVFLFKPLAFGILFWATIFFKRIVHLSSYGASGLPSP